MLTVRLRDGAFRGAASASAAGDTAQMQPRLLRWDRDPLPAPITVFTDQCLPEALTDPSPRKVAWLLEPPSIRPETYAFVRAHRTAFTHVLSHQHAFCVEVNGTWYPFGGTRIASEDWRVWPKSTDVVIIASPKRQTEGHMLRHLAIAQFSQISAYGPEYAPIGERPILALRDARFAVVIENEHSSNWFTEKLIDCLAVGTIPLYWGGGGYGHFNREGIWTWDTFDGLARMLKRATPTVYAALVDQGVVSLNLNAAAAYACVEDWLVEHHPEVFQ